MTRKAKILALIPARGGSVGIKKKNLCEVGGVPMVVRAIKVAQDTGMFAHIAVTTDDPEIAEVARKNGADCILRPADLASSIAIVDDAIIHALEHFSSQGLAFDDVALIEPTTPLRRANTVQNCIQKYLSQDTDYLMTVVAVTENYGRLDANGAFVPLFQDNARRRQDREPLFKEAGVVYLRRVPAMLESRKLMTENPSVFVVDEIEAVDINTPLDLSIARALAQEQEG